MTEQSNCVINTVPAARELRKVPNFDPLKYLRRETSPKTGEKVYKLGLPYKRLWFKMAFPNSGVLFNPLRITDQMAIIEARLYADRNDPTPLANYTSNMLARDVPGGRYIQAAQDEALNEALDNAGFGIQLADLVEMSDGSGYGSEIPVTQVEAAVKGTAQPPRAETVSTAQPPTKQAVPQPSVVQERKEPAVQMEAPAPAPMTAAPTEMPAKQQEAAAPPTVTGSAPATEAPAIAAPEQRTAVGTTGTEPQGKQPSVETANVLQMLGAMPKTTAQKPTPAVEPKTAEAPTPVVDVAPPVPDVEQPAVSAEASDPQAETMETVAAQKVIPPVTYTEDMSVDEIMECMTIEQAREIKVGFGTCNGWTLGQVMDRRPSSLRFYLFASKEASNVLKAAASLLLSEVTQKKAG